MSSTSPSISSTSVYTTTEKKKSYPTLSTILDNENDDNLKRVVRDMLTACVGIASSLRTSLVTVEGSSNTFGDAVLSVDVIADKILWDACHASPVIHEGASEEDPHVRSTPTPTTTNNDNATNNTPDGYTVCWDPLDGSSIIDNNWCVGTIIGIWPSSKGLLGSTGRDQVTAIVVSYGPRTTAIIALRDGVYEFTHGATDGPHSDDWICSRERIAILPTTRIFSPANLRCSRDLVGYRRFIDHHLEKKTTLRYTGGMVPDVYQQFTKGMGVFCNPTSEASPAKLRLAFEAAPFGLLVERAGGTTSDGRTKGGKSVLDVRIESVDQRTALCAGSREEVERFVEFVCSEET